ncbi:MAG: hypothetical protein FJX76_25425 [Armatimonadetes bacterium]|nr:hypothetical protein [Armatimonadota bacterium]
MICIKCGHSNPDNLNYCEKCNAYIFKMAAGGAASSMMELEEGKEYLVPQRSYPTEYLYNLTCRAYEYIHEEASGDPLLEAYQVVKARLDDLEFNSLPNAIASLQAERAEEPEDDYPRQVTYLLTKGVSLYREGGALFDQFVENGENQVLIDAITRMQEGNDNLGLALEMGQAREQLIQEELNRRVVAARQQTSAGAVKGGSGAAEGRLGGGEEGAVGG